MHEDTQPKGGSFKPYSVATFAILAIVGAAAVFAGAAPASAASLTKQVSVEVFAFLVPLTILLAAILIEVTRLAIRNQVPSDTPAAARQVRWAMDREPN